MHPFKHLQVVNHHRFEVFKLCVRCGIIWRGLTHDLSKYSKTEFVEGATYFCGNRSPIQKCRETNGYSLAWVHHIHKEQTPSRILGRLSLLYHDALSICGRKYL